VQEVITTLADPAARLSISVRADRVAVRLKVESDLPLWHAEGPPVIGTLDRVTMVGGTLRLQRTRAGGARVGVNLPLPATR
jgi:glucose-6-phosphate-specific signal transduction histidine kinase